MRVAYSISSWACLVTLVKSQALIAPPALPGRASARSSAPQRTTPVGRYSDETVTNRKIEVAKADFYCIDGFELNALTQRCERKDEIKPEIGCPIGWQYSEGQCETTSVQPADRYCPDGFETILGRCQRLLEAPKQLLCPPAYNHTEWGCVKDVETPPIYECEKGQLHNGACVERKESTMTAVCEEGYELIEGRQCARRRTLPFRETCPTQFTLRDSRCILTEKFTPGVACPDDAIFLDGRCKVEKLVTPFYQCADRRIESADEQCPKEVTLDSIKVCPPGTTTVGDGCLLEEKLAPSHDCPAGSTATEFGCSTGAALNPTSKSCPAGFTMVDKETCYRKTMIPQEIACPPGFSLKGSICAATDYVPPTLMCPEGTTPNGKFCLSVEQFMPRPACPDNTQYDPLSKTCFGERVVELTRHCDVGTYEDAENACVLAEVLAPTLACPPGSKPSTSPNTEALCEENIIRAPQVSCPVDFTLIEATDKPTCRGRAMADGELVCVEPYTEADEKCIYLEQTPKMIGCTDGGFLRGTACITPQKQAPLVLCADGYEYKKETEFCTNTLWSKPIPICEEGFAYDNLVQRCFRLTEFGPNGEILDTTRRDVIPGGAGNGPTSRGSDHPDSDAYKPTEAQLPLNVAPAAGPVTSTTTKTVKAKVEQGSSGKEQFVPMTTFTGADALKQAQTFETLKLANQVAGVANTPVYTPPLTVH